jgi:hypothetical protein
MLNTEAITTWEFGPSGGQDGDDFDDRSSLRHMSSVPRLSSVVIQSEQYIDAIGFMLSPESIALTPLILDPTVGWRDSTVDGPSKDGLLGMHGGPGGHRYEIHLHDGEFVEKISGKYGLRVDSLRIRTNLTTYPEPLVQPDASADLDVESVDRREYGGEGGSVGFSYEAPEGYQIIGVSGRAGQQLDALGVVMCARP